MTKTKRLLFLMLLVLVVIIGFTLIPSDTPDVMIDIPPTNEQGTTTPITVQGETPSIEPEILLVSLREAGVTDLNLETYTEGPYTGPKGSLMDIFSHRHYYTSNIGIGNGLLKDGSCCHSIVIYDFDNTESAEHYAETLTTTFLPNIYIESKVSWSTEARLYLAGSSIVGYVGDDGTVIEELDSTLGKPFIVGNAVWRFNTSWRIPGPPIIHESPIILTSDFSLTTDIKVQGTAFIISRDGITLDLQGHKVFGSEVGDGVLLEGRRGVTITNGLIAGFGTAVRLSNSSDNVVSKIQIRDFSGISVEGNSNIVTEITIVPGPQPERSMFTSIRPTGIFVTGDSNEVSNSSVAEGPIIVQGDGNQINANLLSRTAIGILVNGNNNKLAGNGVYANMMTGTGVKITGVGNEFSKGWTIGRNSFILFGSNDTRVQGNEISGGIGISIQSSHNNIISDNKIGGTPAIALSSGKGNLISNNSISSETLGMNIEADGNEVSGNDLLLVSFSQSGSGGSSMRIGDINVSGNGNLIWGNTINGRLIITGDDNIIFANNFSLQASLFPARDNGMNNRWYKDGQGNYWEEIADSPYLIPGTAGAIDKFPLSAAYQPE